MAPLVYIILAFLECEEVIVLGRFFFGIHLVVFVQSLDAILYRRATESVQLIYRYLSIQLGMTDHTDATVVNISATADIAVGFMVRGHLHRHSLT